MAAEDGSPIMTAAGAAGFHDPGRVFGFFAIAAGMLGIRLAAAGRPPVWLTACVRR